MKLHSRLSKKLFRKYITVYTRIFLIIAILVLAGSLYVILRNTSHNVSTNMSAILDTSASYQTSIYQKSVYLQSDTILQQDLEVCFDTRNRTDAKAKIELDLRNLQTTDSSLLFVLMELSDGTVLCSADGNEDGLSAFIREQEDYKDLRAKNTSLLSEFYSREILQQYISEPEVYYPKYFCVYYTKQLISNHSVLLAYLFDVTQLIESCITEANNLDGFYLYNIRNACIFNWERTGISANIPERASILSPSEIMLRPDGYYYLINNYSSIYAVGFVSVVTLLQEVGLLLAVLLIFYALPLVIALFYLFPVNEKLLSPLYRLNSLMQGFSIGEIPPAPIPTGDEIEDISHSFQQMAMNINQQAGELSRTEHEKALTYYKLMTTQLDPHFVYNTMNIINILARQQDYEGIVKVNTALTRVLRERLNTQNTTYATVGEEINALQQYLLIMDYRYHQQVSVDIDIDDNIRNELIPKNLLQPLVENAYYHGLVKEDGHISGGISIFIYPSDAEIIIEVSDDGVGFDPEHLAYLKTHRFSSGNEPKKDTHIGIENIYQRLSYLYENRFTMDILSNPMQGATIILSLPYVTEPQCTL